MIFLPVYETGKDKCIVHVISQVMFCVYCMCEREINSLFMCLSSDVCVCVERKINAFFMLSRR